MGISDHLTCLLRNLYAGQEATVRTEHGKTDWFQIGKEYVKAVYCHLAYLTYMQSTSCRSQSRTRLSDFTFTFFISGAEGNAEAFRISVLSLVLSLLPYPRLLVTSPASADVSLCRGAGVGRLSFPPLAPLVPNRERSTSSLYVVTLLI